MIMKKTRWLSRETRKENNNNSNNNNERDYYCDANIVLHCDGFFDIQIIVDRIHWLQYWYDQRTVLEETIARHEREKESSSYLLMWHYQW